MGDDTATTLGVLVVTYRSADGARDLLHDLALQPGAAQLHVSVVDNSDDDAELAALDAALRGLDAGLASLTITRAPSNLGYAAGNNLAYARLPTAVDVVCVANPDLRVVAGSLTAAAQRVVDAPATVVVPHNRTGDAVLDGTAAVHLWSGRSRQLAVTDRRPTPSWLTYPGGHFLLLSRELWEQVGGFCEAFFLYSEEVDLAIRAPLSRERIVSDAQLVVSHQSGGTTGSSHGDKSAVTRFHASRSSVLVFRRHRALRRRLPFVVAARTAHGVALAVTRRGGLEVLRGVAAGLRAPLAATAGDPRSGRP